jgi:hypothetical protein
MSRSDETFLSRWSRLKREGPQPAETASAIRPDQPVERPAQSGDPGNPGDDAERAASRQRTQALEDLKSVDIEALDCSSDYTRFMQSGVPDELKNRALRKLWASDPLFAYVDGFDAYFEDFTDAACTVPNLKTAYRIGRGFLNDEEVLAWENLDKPQQPGAAPPSKETVAAASSPVDVGAKTMDEAEGSDGRRADAPSAATSDAAAEPETGDRADVAAREGEEDARAGVENVPPGKQA